jgi:hypothetical protein
MLYAANAAVTLYAYRDVFATTKPVLESPGDGFVVGIDPVTGRADIVTMVWSIVGTGTGAGNRVDLQIREKGDSWAAAFNWRNQAVNAAAPSMTMAAAGATVLFAPRANTEYEWRLRFDAAVNGEVVRTPWTAPFTLKVAGGTAVIQSQAGPVILGPQGGATTGLKPGISWAPIPGATKYQVILATDSALKNRVAGTPALVDAPAWQPAQDLAYDTEYFFGIQAVEPTTGEQSIGTFRTMGKAAPPPPPPVEVKETPPPVINIPPAPTPPPAVELIPPGLLWAIVGIGIVMIVFLVVLVLRTRAPR